MVMNGLKVYKDIEASSVRDKTGIVEGVGGPNNPVNDFTQTENPTATADASSGYAVGSRWINTTTGDVYTCVDATIGAAVWTLGGGGGGEETFTTINAVADFSSSNNIPAPGNYVINKVDASGSNAVGMLNFTPTDGDILKLVYKDVNSGGGYVLQVGTIYKIDDVIGGTHSELILSQEGKVAIIQYFGSAWYPLNSRFDTQM